MRRLLSAALTALLVASLLPVSVLAGAMAPTHQVAFAPAAPATHLSVTAASPQIAGGSFTVTITALDGGDVVDTGYTGTIHLTSSDIGAGLPVDYTFTGGDAGTHDLSVTLATAGSATITATDTLDSGITGTSGSITVTPGVATHLSVTAASPQVAGGSFTVTVTALDAEGNTATGYTGTIHLTSSDSGAVLPADYPFTGVDAGTHDLSVTLATAGSATITATDTFDSGITGTSASITVTPGAASKLVVTTQPSSSSVSEVSLAVAPVIKIEDAEGNVIATDSSTQVTIALTTANGATLSGTKLGPAASGVVTFSGLSIDKAGTYTLTATAAGLTSAVTGTIAVAPGSATHLSVTAASPQVRTVPFNVTVTALDAFGNVDTGYVGTVHVTSIDGAASLPADYTFTGVDAGTHALSVTLASAGTQTITATDTVTPSVTGTSGSITVPMTDQQINFTSTPPSGALINGLYPVTATATSGLGVSLTIDGVSTTTCSISAGTVTFLARGDCVIDANQPGDANWNPAAQVQQTVVVGDTAPTCSGASGIGVVMNVAVAGNAACVDVEGDPLAYAISAPAGHGIAAIDPSTGHWTYTPAANYVGPDSFGFTANDGLLDSAPATISFVVANHQVVAFTDVARVAPVGATVIGVLANDNPGTGDTGQALTISAVTQGAHGRVTNNGATITYDPTGCYVGTDLFTYTASDGLTTSTTAVSVTVVRPGQSITAPGAAVLSKSPVADAPSLAFVVGGTMSSTMPVRLRWCGVTASGASVRSYRLYQSTNNGATFGSTAIVSTTATSSARSLGFGTSYAWRVRLLDSANRLGAYGRITRDRLARIQDSTTALISYSSGWRIARSSGYSGGTERFALSSGARATFHLSGVRTFAVVGSRASGRGSFRVYVDGVLKATVKEGASTTQFRKVLVSVAITSGASHTIVIRPVGNGRIDIDAIVALT